MTALLLTAALLLTGPDAAEQPAAPSWATGWASAYAPGVMESVVAYRMTNDIWRIDPPADWYQVHGYIAAMDCARVGEVTTLTVAGRHYRVLIADCAGDDGPPDRFSRDNIIAELDARLWARLTADHGRPLRIELR